MANIIFQGKKLPVEEGKNVVDVHEELGVTLGCKSGNCGKCLVKVIAGSESLLPPNTVEEEFGLFEGERLFCQLKMGSGDIEIEKV